MYNTSGFWKFYYRLFYRFYRILYDIYYLGPLVTELSQLNFNCCCQSKFDERKKTASMHPESPWVLRREGWVEYNTEVAIFQTRVFLAGGVEGYIETTFPCFSPTYNKPSSSRPG